MNPLSSQLSLVSNLSTAILFVPQQNLPQLDVEDPNACKVFFQKFHLLDSITKIYIGRVINKTANGLPDDGKKGAFLEQCKQYVGFSIVSLNKMRRAANIYEVLLSKMENPPVIMDFKWFMLFPVFNNNEEIWVFYQRASNIATTKDKVPTLEDLKKAKESHPSKKRSNPSEGIFLALHLIITTAHEKTKKVNRDSSKSHKGILFSVHLPNHYSWKTTQEGQEQSF
jgi:hypothetical protein